MGTAPACAREALDMVRAGLGYLAAADATRLAAATQAECLRELEQADAVATAARAAVLAAFTAGQGYAGDAEYSAVSWLMHRTGITRGAAVGHAAWAGGPAPIRGWWRRWPPGRSRSRSARLICLWTSRLPEKFRDESDEVLLAAAAGGLGRGGAGVAGRADVRAGPRRPAGCGPGPGLRGPGAEAGGHVRRRRGASTGT